MTRSIPPFAEHLFFSPGSERSDARPRAKAGRVYVVRQVATAGDPLPPEARASRGLPPFARTPVMLAVLLAVGCSPAAARSPAPDVVHQVEVLEAQVIAARTSIDGCERAMRRAKQRGGVVYVDSHGHCDFVRELPSRKR